MRNVILIYIRLAMKFNFWPKSCNNNKKTSEKFAPTKSSFVKKAFKYYAMNLTKPKDSTLQQIGHRNWYRNLFHNSTNGIMFLGIFFSSTLSQKNFFFNVLKIVDWPNLLSAEATVRMVYGRGRCEIKVS